MAPTHSRSTSPAKCHGGPVFGQQTGQGLPADDRIESNSRLCIASAGTGYKLSLGADGPPGPTRTSIGRMCFSSSARTWPTAIPSSSADDGPPQGRCETHRRRPPAPRHRRQGRLVPADQARHRPGTPQRTAAPSCGGGASGAIDYQFIAEHTYGWDAIACRSVPTTRRTGVAEITGLPESDIRTAARMIADARGGGGDELLDDGAQPEHARHLSCPGEGCTIRVKVAP